MELNERIKRKRQQSNLSVPRLANLLNVNKENLYKWEKGAKPSDPEEYQRLMRWLDDNTEHSSFVSESGPGYAVAKNSDSLTMQAIVNLTQSNKVLSESNKILATSHSELVEMVKLSGSGAPGSPPDELAIFSDLLEALADVASGKRYRSKQEALAALSKYVHAAAEKRTAKGTLPG